MPIDRTGFFASLKNAAGKVFTYLNTLTLSGTDGSTLNIGTGGTLGTAAYTAAADYDDIIINRNIQETTASYSLAAGYNGVVLGPFTVGNGFTFTIADGDRFMVLND